MIFYKLYVKVNNKKTGFVIFKLKVMKLKKL